MNNVGLQIKKMKEGIVMKKMIKMVAMFLCISILSGSLYGCSSKNNGTTNNNQVDTSNSGEDVEGSKEKVEITFWTQDSTTFMNWFKPVVEEFNSQSETVHVNAEYFPNFSDKLTQAFAAEQQPDIAFTWQSITQWAKAGKLAPAPESYLTKEEFSERFYEGALVNKMYNGEYYCAPTEINVESPTLYVNMDILEKAGKKLPDGWVENNGPKSWDELYEFAKGLTIKEGDLITQSGLAYAYSTWEAMFASLIWQYGGDYRDEANQVVNFNTLEGKKAAEFMLKYCQGEDAISDGATSRYDLFTQGNAAMCIGAPWYAGSFATDAPDMNYQVFNMPAFVEDAKPYCVATGGWGYVVSSQSSEEVQQAAWEFAKYMTSTEISGSWALGTGALSADKLANSDIEYDPNVGSVEKTIAISKEILEYGLEDGAYTLDASQLLYTIVRQQLRQMVEDQNIDLALQTMEAEGNEMIETNLNR